jgi:hypothetical protein
MDIVRKLRRLESRIAGSVNAAAQKMALSGPREPLEITHAILEAVEKRIEPAGRGKYIFPFNQIGICIAAAERETRARFEAVLDSNPSLQERIVQTLLAAGCESANLTVETTYADHPETQWTTSDFDIRFDRVRVAVISKPDTQTDQQGHTLKLTTVQGTTDNPIYSFTTSRINLGRCPEVRDHRNRLIRTNHVAFGESAGESNLSVSRHHAHIDCTANAGEYRLCDDRSAHGTSVQRNGKTIAVPAGPRGIRLQTGDEITLGQARLLVEIEMGKMGS